MTESNSNHGDSEEEVLSSGSSPHEGTAKVSMAPSPCPAEASTSSTAGATTGRKRNTEVGPMPPEQSQCKKAKITLGSTFNQAKEVHLLGVFWFRTTLTKSSQ